MKDFISCRNCKKKFDHVFHKPFLLPCLGAICKSCIQEISESQSYECSKCSHNHTCFQNDQILLQIDNTREIASEIFRLKNGGSSLICEMCTNDQMASHRCFDCSVFICEDCVRLHLSLKTLKSHSFIEIKCLLTGKVQNLGLSYVSKYCQVPGHEKEQIKMHCCDPSCMKNVCVLCAISAHKNHNLCDITEVGKEMDTKMEISLKSIELKVEKANTSIAHLTAINEKSLNNSQQVQAEIKACFFEAKKALEKREKELCEAVALHLKEKQMCIETEKEKISSFSSSCEEAICYGKVSSEVNDHNHFVDIANVILPQLEILDSQSPEIEVTFDTMTFSSKSLDFWFETAVNSLGKLSVSNAYSPKSKVVVTPAVCYVGQQIQFKIQLFSSTGNLIVDEDVSVCLKLNGESFEFINCAFETSSSSFTGLWVPDKSMKISWIVVSNEIELQTLKGVIDINQTEKSSTGNIPSYSVIDIDKTCLFKYDLIPYFCLNCFQFLCISVDKENKEETRVSN